MPDLPYEISPAEVKRKLDAGEPLVLIDVREPFEVQLSCIAGAELIPMDRIPAQQQRLEGLSDETPLVIYCHHGMRSLQVVAWLRRQGIENCQSLSGGIDLWSTEVDPAVPRY